MIIKSQHFSLRTTNLNSQDSTVTEQKNMTYIKFTFQKLMHSLVLAFNTNQISFGLNI